MNAAETSASSAMADWTPLTVVPISRTTAEIDTFISDASTTSTNIALADFTLYRHRQPEALSVICRHGDAVAYRKHQPALTSGNCRPYLLPDGERPSSTPDWS